MADEKKLELTIEQRMTKLTSDLQMARQDIDWMKTRGGFTDAKTHSMRAARIEQRLELVELDSEMLKDVSSANLEAWQDHLQDRHDCHVERDSAIDATAWRKMRHRLKTWMQKRGLLTKRREDVRSTAPGAQRQGV